MKFSHCIYPGKLFCMKRPWRNSSGLPAKAGSEENDKNHKWRRAEQRSLSSKIPVHSSEGLSGSAETVGPSDAWWGKHLQTTTHGSPFAWSLGNMSLRAEHRNGVCPKGWNILRLFILKLLSLGRLETLWKSSSDYNILC